MVITDYPSLKQTVADYLDRSNLNQFIPNFIQNCESTLYKTLRIRAMENSLSVTTSGGAAAVPTSPAYIELKYAYVNSSPVTPLTRVLPEQIYELSPDRSVTTTTPKYIATSGDSFIFSKVPSDGVSIRGIYYGRLDPLSGVNTSNWFTSYAPDLLLYGSLLEAEPFISTDARIQTWQMMYQRAYRAVDLEEKRQQHSGGKLSARIS